MAKLPFLGKKSKTSLPISPIAADNYAAWLKKQDAATAAYLDTIGFKSVAGAFAVLPAFKDGTSRVLFIPPKQDTVYAYADLPARLPRHEGGYFIDADLPVETATNAALGWALGAYAFDRYKKTKHPGFAKLVMPANADAAFVTAAAEATHLVRDLVNIPANDLGPAELEKAATDVARNFNKTSVSVIRDKDLLKQNYPAIYTVGQASPRAPRLIDMTWGDKKHPKVTIVGKGVCFDTGGLDIKPSSAMELMKKDMGGAAHALGLAHMIMALNLPVRMRVLIPAVENSISGNAFRPGDVVPTRKGLTIEVGNTDAEGRVILADALFEACKEKPDLLIDFATLTGAARVALGPDLPAVFSNNDALAKDFVARGHAVNDPAWQLPLWQPYNSIFASKVADINNSGTGGMAGSITAALFLQHFVDNDVKWLHLDTYAWNLGNAPGRPSGGEALGMRAAFDLIRATANTKAPSKKPKTPKAKR